MLIHAWMPENVAALEILQSNFPPHMNGARERLIPALGPFCSKARLLDAKTFHERARAVFGHFQA